MKSFRVAIACAGLLSSLVACTGGGPDAPASTPPSTPPTPSTSPTIDVLPTSFDFGKVTVGNSPAPLEITIRNLGTATLNIRSIDVGGNSNFALTFNAGTKPCGSATPSLAPGDGCTARVAFQGAAAGGYTGTVQISSNDGSKPVVSVPILAALESISRLTVRINQVQAACPTNEVTAYVSVTDQGGYPVKTLQAANFTVALDTAPRSIKSVDYVETAYQPIAAAGGLDFSSSLTNLPVAFGDMRNGFAQFFGNMRTGDMGEVVKFGASVEVTQPFTTDKARLVAAIVAPFTDGGATKLYDAAIQAVNDTAVNTTYRRAVVMATDGQDNASTATLTDAVNNAKAKGVPIFVIGLGTSISRASLDQLATDTGGVYYEASTSQNLATIYQQLSSILYEKQYLVKFDQVPKGSAGVLSNLTIGATYAGMNGSAARSLASCN